MPAPNPAPITETQFQQLLAVATAIGARTAQAVPAAAPTPAPVPVDESVRLRAMSTQELSHEYARRVTESQAMQAPGWIAEARTRGVPMLFEQATGAQPTVEEAALAALNDPRTLAQASTGDLARQIRVRMNHAHGLRSPGWR
jgi:hypothetical protein